MKPSNLPGKQHTNIQNGQVSPANTVIDAYSNHDPAPKGVDDRRVGFVTALFTQSLFPYRAIEAHERVVFNRARKITISSSEGLPFGKYPRLIIAFIITSTIERHSRMMKGELTEREARQIPLGKSLNDFFENIGLSGRVTGGSRGTINLIRTQVERLVATTISVSNRATIGDAKRVGGGTMPIVASYDLWYGASSPDQLTLGESYIYLTEQFFEEISKSPVPIDLDILSALNSPRAMDLYVWTTLKQFWLLQAGMQISTFTWSTLAEQFSAPGLTTSRQRSDFRKQLRRAAEDVLAQWPDAGITVTSDGLTIRRTSPSIDPKKPKFKVIG